MAHNPRTKATLARARLVGQLRRCDELGAAAVAAVLAACTDTHPCRSAACPVCGLAFQATAVALVEEFIRTPAREIRNRMTAITVVPAVGCVPPDALTVADFERVGAQITAAFAALNLPATIIGLEASFNEDTTGHFEDHWCGHTHSIQHDWLSKAQEEGLKDRFPRSRLIRRPVRCDRLDGRDEGRRYPFKPERVRRVHRLGDGPSRTSTLPRLQAPASAAMAGGELGHSRASAWVRRAAPDPRDRRKARSAATPGPRVGSGRSVGPENGVRATATRPPRVAPSDPTRHSRCPQPHHPESPCTPCIPCACCRTRT